MKKKIALLLTIVTLILSFCGCSLLFEEKAQIKDLFQKAADLNAILDKYDIETKFDWNEYLTACSQYFDAMR